MKLKYLITKRLKNWLIFVLVRFFFALLQNTPRALAFVVLTRISLLCFYVIPDARRKTIRHLARVFPEKSAREIYLMAYEVFRNLGRNGVDMFRLKKVVGKNPYKYVSIRGQAHLDAALAHGKGVIVITGHIGCWELMAGFISRIGYRVAVVGTPLYDPRLDQMLVENRTSVGLTNIVRDTGARQILKTLHAGQIVGILIDQDTKVDGEFVDFLGTPALTPVGPVTLALKTGARIVPMSIHIQPDNRHEIVIEPEIELQTEGERQQVRQVNTLKCSKAVEKMLLIEPTQWVWMHERWKTRPEKNDKFL